MMKNKFENIREEMLKAGITESPEEIKATNERLALSMFLLSNS